MDSGRYILEGKIPVPCENLFIWAQWIQNHRKERVVAQDYVGDFWISTAFLGLDDNWLDGPPHLVETMVFKGKERHIPDDAPMIRTATWELALEAHAEVVLWASKQLS